MKKDFTDKMIFGVCSGLAKEFNIDVAIIRAVFVILTFMGFGSPIIIYLILAAIMPEN